MCATWSGDDLHSFHSFTGWLTVYSIFSCIAHTKEVQSLLECQLLKKTWLKTVQSHLEVCSYCLCRHMHVIWCLVPGRKLSQLCIGRTNFKHSKNWFQRSASELLILHSGCEWPVNDQFQSESHFRVKSWDPNRSTVWITADSSAILYPHLLI